MRRSEQQPTEPPGVLRVLALFHETKTLGASMSVLQIADELAAYGWTMSGWLPGAGELDAVASRRLGPVFHADSPLAYSARGWREKPGVLSRTWRSPRYLRAVRDAIDRVRPHVVHANTLLSLPEAAVARSCGLPIVLQSHEVPVPSLKTALATRSAAEIADVLVGVSDAASSALRRSSGRTPVLTVRNGIAEAEPRNRTDKGAFVVGTVGTVSRTKGTDVFLRAARLALEQRPGMRFEHVGAANLHRDRGLDDELARLRTQIRPADALAMRGPLPAAEVLPHWDVFVSASRSDAFPLATMEAMAAGLPVVAPTVGGIPEQIAHLESGILVRPDDPEAIATWLVRLHDEPELRERLGVAATRRARAEFTLARQAAGLHEAYLMALNRRFAPRRVRHAAGAAA